MAKRPLAAIDSAEPMVSSSPSSVQERNDQFICPICFDLIQKASVTKCGHTFCYQCIVKSIERFERCPKCYSGVTSREIFPNYLLDELIKKHKLKVQLLGTTECNAERNLDGLKAIVKSESKKFSLPEINQMLEILNERKQLLEAESNAVQYCLLHDFLKHLLKKKEEQHAQVLKEICIVKRDLELTENTLKDVPNLQDVKLDVSDDNIASTSTNKKPEKCSALESVPKNAHVSFASRRKRMYSQFDDFVTLYFSSRRNELPLAAAGGDVGQVAENAHDMDDKMKVNISPVVEGLNEFRDNLVKFSRYNRLKPLATLKYSVDLSANSTIVSTIEFDKDNEYFAIGGVTKRIKIYDYAAVISDAVDIHYPCIEMVSSSKVSCIAWNAHHKNILAASDYEGAVNIWDTSTGQMSKCFHEHEKRCWSVDFNDMNKDLIVSGSDDGRVKLWALKVEHSIATLEAKANICCVKFNPRSSWHFAFGSADHDVHYYDLRNLSKAVAVFHGHKKAVSYVKFLNAHELISASTDSQLKLWDVTKSPYCLRSFTGHVNDKNFIGLAADRDYLACGSEDNAVYIYYKGLSKQLFNFKFENKHDQAGSDNDFVSAVCWRKQCSVVLAANSRGIIKVLELV